MAADVKHTDDSNSVKSISVEDLLPSADTTGDGKPPDPLISSSIASVLNVIVQELLSRPLKSTTSDPTKAT